MRKKKDDLCCMKCISPMIAGVNEELKGSPEELLVNPSPIFSSPNFKKWAMLSDGRLKEED
jgi:hypothetical protein